MHRGGRSVGSYAPTFWGFSRNIPVKAWLGPFLAALATHAAWRIHIGQRSVLGDGSSRAVPTQKQIEARNGNRES